MIYSLAARIGKFQFHKRSRLFVRTHDETLSVVAMYVSNPDRSPVGINRCNAAPTPTGLAEIVSDEFPRTFSVFWCRQDAGRNLIRDSVDVDLSMINQNSSVMLLAATESDAPTAN